MVEKSPVEVTFPLAVQSIRPCPLIVPLTSAITPSVRRVSSSGWKFGPKVSPGHVERRVAGAARQPVLDAHVGDQRAARGMAERAGRADEVAGEREVDVIAPAADRSAGSGRDRRR